MFSKPDALALRWDARTAAHQAARFAQAKSFDDYMADDLLRSAVERQFTIIGEALSQLRKLDRDLVRKISDVDVMIDMRNVLVHGYALIDDMIVWGGRGKPVGPWVDEIDGLLAMLD